MSFAVIQHWSLSRSGRALKGAFVAAIAASILVVPSVASAVPVTSVNLATYVRVGRYDLPEPTRTVPPVGSLLAQEVSAVTYNWDTDTLFVAGDGSTSIVQVSKTGTLINSMNLELNGAKPQGTEFYDVEGLAYVGGGKFIISEERDRQIDLFTYAPGTTLLRSQVQTVDLGTFVDNIGTEGITRDPLTGGYVAIKEKTPQGIFQTTLDFATGTASNGSPTTVDSTNLFDPALLGVLDFSDVFAFSNAPSMAGQPDQPNMLVISQESGKLLEVDRSGAIKSSLTINASVGDTLSIPDQQHEGVTMDNDGIIYTVAENGGGDINHPQLWVYAPSTTTTNLPPTSIVLTNQVPSIPETTSTAAAVKVADITVIDDSLGTNALSLTGADAASFDLVGTSLFLKAGTVLNSATKPTFVVTINADDVTVGATPDATATFTLTIGGAASVSPIVVTEVAPWSSGNSPFGADWFELTNTGTTPVDITGWKMDDNSNAFGSAVALTGITTIGAGESVVFVEGTATTAVALKASWFGSKVPASLQVGFYSGAGVGLSTGGDAVNIFDSAGTRITGIAFGASVTGFSFDNKAGLASSTLPLPIVGALSVSGLDGAFVAADGHGTGSPGTIVAPVIVSEIAPWASGNASYAADWFELTNTGTVPVDLTGWKMDDNSNLLANAVALNAVTILAPGQSVIFVETATSTALDAFKAAWYANGIVAPTFLIGNYSGTGVGLSTGGDAVNIFDATGARVTGVSFGASVITPSLFSFDNSAGLGSRVLPLPVVSTLSAVGVNGAFVSFDTKQTGSPGAVLAVEVPLLNAQVGLLFFGATLAAGATLVSVRRRRRSTR